MILSRHRNFIFLHTPKTAGSSVALSLATDMAPDDVMIGCWVDARKRNLPYNDFALKIARQYQPGCTLSALGEFIRHGAFLPKPSFVNNHIKDYFRKHHGFFADAHSPADVVRAFDPELWARAFKFTFVRNPWTHAVSNYKWCTKPLLKQRGSVSFKEFLRRNADKNRPDPEHIRPPILSNWAVYTINNQIVADYVGRFETIHADLEQISKRLGFEVSIRGIRAKTGVRNAGDSIADYYDEECVELVRQIYRNEIEAFSYSVPF